ncbi:hypothetical protein EDC38_0065 [Marinimicrobium koreense]|uniref:Uncharacterized protein n=1 Tax=Marinimicrobium koreense TaxID=306545 RepID=A0A3N1NTJ6_9GAMM|nr:hypothetical protein EDC38_0065 [Marinimicrobium koreense]
MKYGLKKMSTNQPLSSRTSCAGPRFTRPIMAGKISSGRTMSSIYLILIVLLSVNISASPFGLDRSDLIGEWVPTGKMRDKSTQQKYRLIVNSDFSSVYEHLSDNSLRAAVLNCELKPNTDQKLVFIFYCSHEGTHLYTLTLSGWRTSSGYVELFGFEYWHTFGESDHIMNGLPLSFKRAGT